MNRHGKNRLTFAALSFAGQSRSITGAVRHLERAVLAHLRRATAEGRDRAVLLGGCIARLSRLIERLQQHTMAPRAAQPARNTTVNT
jgi:hypothetical protein